MTTQKPIFDMEAAIKALREGKDLTGKEGVLTPLIKLLTESASCLAFRNHDKHQYIHMLIYIDDTLEAEIIYHSWPD